MKVIIVGAHGEAKELINRISTGWNVSVIDMDQDKLRNFNPNRQIEKYQGDGTSTLVLKKAGIETASALITLTQDDEVNIEILKIAKSHKISRLSSVINDESNIKYYDELEVELVDPNILLARRFEHILEPRRVVSQAFAGGRAEAIELEVNADSPVRGKKLNEIGSDYFIVGALLRKGKVVIPHGDTELQTQDLVTVVLQSGAFGNVIKLFSGSESRFPLEFGKNTAIVINSEEELKNLTEAEFYTRNTNAEELVILSQESIFTDSKEEDATTFEAILKDLKFRTENTQKNSLKEIESKLDELSIGTLIIPVTEDVKVSTIRSYINFSNKNKIPILFSRGTSPINNIGFLSSSDFSENSPTTISFDIASTLKSKVFAVVIDQPKFISHENTESKKSIIQKLQDAALSNEVQLEILSEEGNEAKIFTSLTDKFDLSIIGHNLSTTWQLKKTTEFISQNSSSSVLYIPI
ncbi:NAD-binding protein [Acidimicrobiia bacterium]|nr:NAD-binding protein [Acidimicrobiaceae bacterium]MDA9845416.1 NAD-binding protein [Acidimicrobiia bacterium]MDC3374419.1 NAD-binding protein [Acidimicrobiia bacterium]